MSLVCTFTAPLTTGNHVVLYHLETKSQSFFPTNDKTEAITAITVSPSHRYLAIAERGEHATITVWDIQAFARKKVLHCPDVTAREYTTISFAPDNQHIIAMTADPDWALVLYKFNAKQNKVISVLKEVCGPSNAVTQVSFSPQDAAFWCASGTEFMSFFRFSDKAIRPVGTANKTEDVTYTCHCWVDEDRVVAGTDRQGLALFEAGDFKMTLQPAVADSPDLRVTCCTSLGSGFVVGLEGATGVVYTPSDGRDLYRPGQTIAVPAGLRDRSVLSSVAAGLVGDAPPLHFTSVSASQSHEAVTFTTSGANLLSANLVSAELRARLNGSDSAAPIELRDVGVDGHGAEAIDLDVCLKRPIVATVGRDHVLNVFDYEERTVELTKQFPESCHAVAIHPSGFYVAVSTADKVRLCALLNDDIRVHKELNLKAVRTLEFSAGGMYLACVTNVQVIVYNVYTYELVTTLRGHNSKVRSLSWARGDTQLTTAGMDGAVYTWALPEGRRVREFVDKAAPFTSVVAMADGETVVAAATDSTIRMLVDGAVTGTLSLPSIPKQIALTAGESHLVVGTSLGSLRVYPMPFMDGDVPLDPVLELPAHAGTIHRLKVSADGSRVLTVGADGTLQVHTLTDPNRLPTDAGQAMEVLVARTELADKTSLVAELQTKIDELTVQAEYQLRLRDLGHQEAMKVETAKWTEVVDKEKAALEQTEQDKAELELALQRRLKAAEEEHGTQQQQLELQYQQKLATEVERYQKLQADRAAGQRRADEHSAGLIASHERVIQDLTSSYEEKIQELSLLLENALQRNDELQREFDETRDQMEEDADTELDDMRRGFEGQLDDEKDATLRLKGENGVLKRKFTVLQGTIQKQHEKLEEEARLQRELLQKIEGHKKDKEGLRKEITERDETIADKERRIYDLKKKNQELEKFKFVLDYKIKELKRQIEPRELEIGAMREQIREMDGELERFHKANNKLELQLTDLRLKSDALQREGAATRRRLTDSEHRRRDMEAGLEELVGHIQEPRALKEGARRMYQRHVTGTSQTEAMETDLREEYERQRQYLEKTVKSLKTQLSKEGRVRSADHRHILQENVELIKEINTLRKELKGLRTQTQTMQLAPRGTQPVAPGEKQLRRDLEQQRIEIVRLRQTVAELEDTQAMRPTSREELPPIDTR